MRGGYDDQLAARKPLARVIVRVAFQFERDAGSQKRSETLSRRARERKANGLRLADPSHPYLRAISPDSIAPTVRSTLRIGSLKSTAVRSQSPACASSMSRLVERRFQPMILRDGAAPAHARRHRRHEQQLRIIQPRLSSDRWPDASRSCPRGRSCRSSSGSPSSPSTGAPVRPRRRNKLMTFSGVPVNFLRSAGSCVAMPTGQVFRWHLRIMMQPIATSGAWRSRTPPRPAARRSPRRGRFAVCRRSAR